MVEFWPTVVASYIHATALLTLAAGLVWLLRTRSAALRHCIWAVALTSTLVLPLVGPLLPELIPMPRGLLPQVLVAVLPQALSHPPTADGVLASGPASAVGERADVTSDLSLISVLPIAWGAGVVFFAGKELLSLCLLLLQRRFGVQLSWSKIRADLRDTSPSIWGDALADAERRGVRIIMVSKSSEIVRPCTWGWPRAIVIVPASASEWSSETWAHVLVHEIIHVQRHDFITRLIGNCAFALYWLSPAVWIAQLMLRHEAEQATDDEVLRREVLASAYATTIHRFLSEEKKRSLSWNGLIALITVGVTQHTPFSPFSKKLTFKRFYLILDKQVCREDKRSVWILAVGVLICGVIITSTASPPTTTMASGRVQGSVARDREALEALFHATDGPNWTNNTNWLSDAPLDEWHGVFTDESGRVSDLWIHHNGLRGQLPEAIGSLDNLEGLMLYYNELSGPLPDAIGSLVNLKVLWLQNNELSGPLPNAIGSLYNLELLMLTENKLSGPLPSAIGGLRNLLMAELSNNEFAGPFPPIPSTIVVSPCDWIQRDGMPIDLAGCGMADGPFPSW